MAVEDVITLDDALDHLQMTDAGDDAAELGLHISAASQAVEWFVGPVIIREFVDYEQQGRNALVLDKRPVVSLVSLVGVDGAVEDVSGFRVVPTAGLVRPVGGGRLPCGPFDVTYTAGRAATVADVPDALALACRIIVANLWETQRAPTLGPQPGFDEFTPAVTGPGFAVPYRAQHLMAPYRTVAVA